VKVSDAVRKRVSTRAFLPHPVSGVVVRELLEQASRSPSGGNLQPWRVHVLGGSVLLEFTALIAAKLEKGDREQAEYAVYPPNLWEPLRARRKRAGDQRYAALGMSRDQNAQTNLEAANYRFFGAPVGLFFFLDRRTGPPQWADTGMFMQTLMLLAVERGLATCPQEVWSNWPLSVSRFCGVPEGYMLFAGMSLGYADTASPMNGYTTERAALGEFASMAGFD
jgi:nitroreductase